MPYSRQRRSRRSRRLPYRRPIRRSRPIRRRAVRRRPLTRRRILQVSTEKKQDNRLTFSNVDSPTTAPTQKPVVLTGGITYLIPYMCTAQDKSHLGSGVIPNYRNRDDVFMRGYKERIRFVTGDSSAWTHRRICFTLKGNAIINSTSATSPLFLEAAPNGWVRTATQANGTGLGNAIINEMFKGNVNVDWTNYFTAKVDTNRVTVMFDKTWHYRAGNDTQHVHDRKLWHPMNKNFYYRDDESGNTQVEGAVHIGGHKGMGDYYIIDIIENVNQDTESIAQLQYEGTLYWHER